MATLEKPTDEHVTNGGSGGPPPNDDVRIHPFLYPHSTSKSTSAAKLAKQLGKLASEQQPEKRMARAYLTALDEARGAVLAALESGEVSAEAREAALASYLGLLQGLVGTPHTASVPPAGADPGGGGEGTASDAALAAAEAGAAAGLVPNSRLRFSATFEWKDALVGNATTQCSDALFEMASMMLAAVLVAARQAAKLCEDSVLGVPTSAAVQAYTLLREGSGRLDFIVAQLLPQLPPTGSTDLDPGVLTALSSLLLADAQSLTVQRAVARGNQPSLVSAMAADTAQLYQTAGRQLQSSAAASGAGGGSKLAHYCVYKQRLYEAYAQLQSGVEQWQGRQAPGLGLRCVQEAAGLLDAAKKAASAFDAALPASMNLLHRGHDSELADAIAHTRRRMQREAESVYFQKMSAELPPLPGPRRLVSQLPFALPPPAPMVAEGAAKCFPGAPPAPAPAAEAASGAAAASVAAAGAAPPGAAAAPAAAGAAKPAAEVEDAQGCSCWRWALFLVASPLLLMISLVGVVVWIVLLPLKLLCCPVGCLAQLLYDVVEGLVKLPLRAMAAAAGKPWERTPPPQPATPAVKQ